MTGGMPERNKQESHLFYQSKNQRPVLEYAEGVYMYDKNGKRYLDGSSGAMVSNIGHSNKRVLKAMQEQMDKATFGYRLHFQTEPAETLARMTAGLMPDGLDKVFFASGGSEGVESAIKLARQYAVTTGAASRWKVISRYPSYHGASLGALALTGYDPLTQPFEPMMRVMPKIDTPRYYLDRDGLSKKEHGLRYAELLRKEIIQQGPETVLAFIMEPVGGASTGALVAPDSYYARIREICDEFGILLIYDEVMTGAGRTGKFLAAEHWNIKPDIVVLSKGFGAGYVPLAAVVADNVVVDAVVGSGGFQHGFTYAGNPLACAAGVAVIEELYEHDLMDNATRMGKLLKAELRKLKNRYPFIGSVRGKGLLLAFELVKDRDCMTPLPKEFDAFNVLVNLAYDNGLIIYSRRTRGGYIGDHFLVCPPLITTAAHIEEIIEKLVMSLDEFAERYDLPVISA